MQCTLAGKAWGSLMTPPPSLVFPGQQRRGGASWLLSLVLPSPLISELTSVILSCSCYSPQGRMPWGSVHFQLFRLAVYLIGFYQFSTATEQPLISTGKLGVIIGLAVITVSPVS